MFTIPLFNLAATMRPSVWKANTSSIATPLNRYQTPPRGDFVAYLDTLLSQQQADLLRLNKMQAAKHKSKTPKAVPKPQAETQSVNKTETAPTRKRFKTTTQTAPSSKALSKPNMVWLVISIFLAIVVPPVGSLLLLWTLAKAFMLKLKPADTSK